MAKPDPNRLRIARSSFLGTPLFLTRGGSSRFFVRLPAILLLFMGLVSWYTESYQRSIHGGDIVD